MSRLLILLLSTALATTIFPKIRLNNANANRIPVLNIDSVLYKVFKIDSINRYYLIYARKQKRIYKIISPKWHQAICDSIKVGSLYEFKLNSINQANGLQIIPPNEIMELSGWRIDSITFVNLEGDSVRDLYYAENVRSLCMIRE